MHHLICVHGIGSHSTDWIREDQDYTGLTFEEFLEQKFELLYPELIAKNKKLSDYVTLHSVCYDNEIERILDHWDAEFNKLLGGIASSPTLMDKVDWYIDLAANAKEGRDEGKFSHTHLVDLLFYFGSPTFQRRLRTNVVHQLHALIDVIHREDKNRPRISLLGHSMGTSMIDKAVKDLFHEPLPSIFPDQKEQLFGHFSFSSIIQVANCSRTLSRVRDESFYTTAIKPGLGNRAYCLAMLNLNHQYDPVGRFIPVDFDHHGWIDPRVKAREYLKDVLLNDITSHKIHSLQHYLSDPVSVVPFFQFLIGKAPKFKNIDHYVSEHNSTSLDHNTRDLISRFKEIDARNPESFHDFFQSLVSYVDILKAYGDAL